MNEHAKPESMTQPALAAEWSRVSMLLALAEAGRTGGDVSEDFAERFVALNELVAQGRETGSWDGLRDLIDRDLAQRLIKLDIDILALALAAEASPAFAPRIQSLQPHLGSPWPSLALIQELLMLEDAHEADALIGRLAPENPLVASGAVRIEGEGAYQIVRPGAATGLAVLGRSLDSATPPGASLVTRRASFDQLVASPETLSALKDFVSWVRFGRQVYRDWGARKLGGPLVLFNGPSGVGKTFAASAVAGELARATGEHWALYSLDLGRVMSKYVGETEKNINRLLDAVSGRRAILQIDEADGLLGKRGDVSDARDRYSNLEVSHMLSRFEAHDGPVILTTNMRANIDGAFLRRFQIVVDFPGPDAAAREKLWRLLIPPSAPIDEAVEPQALAGAVKLAGGAIHNAAVYASMLAAGEGGPLGYRHFARAVWSELNKESRQVRRSELGFLAEHLEKAS
ncbi:ATP-binding protein [Methylopila sp. M107]|uniref:ATP-binding protein n=1 Tax=Methylopila sp. M107 TaxID=1101190 RepID=UPI000367A65B|nr:ATP-binding protein [Methylopila sp. M107]